MASSEEDNFTTIPYISASMIPSNLDYLHITTNNTIEGTKYTEIPQVATIPLVADMSSNILSEEYDVNQFGVIYAGAQKNLGPAGLTIVIVKKGASGESKGFLSSYVKL